MGLLDWLGFQARVDAGPQSSGGYCETQGDVTVHYTEDTSAPYPYYMHQPVTEYGVAAEMGAYEAMVNSQEASDEAQILAGRMLDTIE
jgi:hypothetical protein